MPILWNDQVLENSVVEKLVEKYMPKGKSKIVTFTRMNAQPFRALGKGKTLQKMGGENQLPSFNRTVLPDLGEGVLRYYKTVQDIANRGGMGYRKEFSPNFITFFAHNLTFDASKDKALFLFCLYHSKNELSEAAGEVPEFRFARPSELSKKTVQNIELEAEAISKVRELKDKNKKQLRAFYESLGYTDFAEKSELGEWNDIMARLYEFCKNAPQDALDKMNDAALDIVSKVVQALEHGIIKRDGKTIFWGDQVKAEVKKRKITDIPRGKESNWQDWFATNFLRSEVDVAQELDTELKLFLKLSGN